MAERNEAVFHEIIVELRQRPELSLGVLYQLAVHLDPALAGLPPRQFNATYVMPARHQITLETRGAQRPRRQSGRTRDSARKPSVRPPPSAAPVPSSAPPAPAPAASAAGSVPPAAEPTVAVPEPSPPAPEPRLPVPAPAMSAPATPRRARPQTAAPAVRHAVDRSRVRAALMNFARDIAAAEGRAELVRVLTEVDGYVEQIYEKDDPD